MVVNKQSSGEQFEARHDSDEFDAYMKDLFASQSLAAARMRREELENTCEEFDSKHEEKSGTNNDNDTPE